LARSAFGSFIGGSQEHLRQSARRPRLPKHGNAALQKALVPAAVEPGKGRIGAVPTRMARREQHPDLPRTGNRIRFQRNRKFAFWFGCEAPGPELLVRVGSPILGAILRQCQCDSCLWPSSCPVPSPPIVSRRPAVNMIWEGAYLLDPPGYGMIYPWDCIASLS